MGPKDRTSVAMHLASEGWSNKKIARELGVSEPTISRLLRVASLPPPRRIADGLRDVEGLSRAERQVAGLAAAGQTNQAIGAARGTSARTVANQLRSAYGKLGVSSRRELRASLLAVSGRKK